MTEAYVCARCEILPDGRIEVTQIGIFSDPARALTVVDFRGFYADIFSAEGDDYAAAENAALARAQRWFPEVYARL